MRELRVELGEEGRVGVQAGDLELVARPSAYR